VKLRIRKGPVHVSVSFRSIAIEVVRPENDFQRAAAANQVWEAFRTAAAGMHSHPDFRLTQSGLIARCEAHVAGKDELAAHPADAAPDLCDADHRGLGETDEGIDQNREARRSHRSSNVSYLAGQIKMGEVELR